MSQKIYTEAALKLVSMCLKKHACALYACSDLSSSGVNALRVTFLEVRQTIAVAKQSKASRIVI